jgi:hypothetical protein
MKAVKLAEQERVMYRYQDIICEAAKWRMEGMSKFIRCVYITLPLATIPEKLKKDFWLEDEMSYLSSEELQNIPFHQGITFYEKRISSSGYMHLILGCDYHHFTDLNRPVPEEEILENLQTCIDYLLERFKDIEKV